MIDLQNDLIKSERDKFEAIIATRDAQISKLKRENAILKND